MPFCFPPIQCPKKMPEYLPIYVVVKHDRNATVLKKSDPKANMFFKPDN